MTENEKKMSPSEVYASPMDVLKDETLDVDVKKVVLANWLD